MNIEHRAALTRGQGHLEHIEQSDSCERCGDIQLLLCDEDVAGETDQVHPERGKVPHKAKHDRVDSVAAHFNHF